MLDELIAVPNETNIAQEDAEEELQDTVGKNDLQVLFEFCSVFS